MSTTCTDLPAYAATDVDGIVHALEEDGCAFIPGLISRDLAAETRDRIDRLDFPAGDGQGNGKGIDHHKCVFNRDPYWLQFIDPPGVIESVEKLMGPKCHIIGQSAWRTPPGAGGMSFHSDQLFVPMDEELLISGRVKLPMFIGTLHYYLSDMDLDLCPTWVVPGTHKAGRGPGKNQMSSSHDSTVSGDERSWRGREAMPILCKAGDGLLFRSEIWHSGSKNVTADRWRYLLQTHYAQRGIAQRFPPYLDFRYNPEVVAACNPRQRRMIGGHEISAYG